MKAGHRGTCLLSPALGRRRQGDQPGLSRKTLFLLARAFDLVLLCLALWGLVVVSGGREMEGEWIWGGGEVRGRVGEWREGMYYIRIDIIYFQLKKRKRETFSLPPSFSCVCVCMFCLLFICLKEGLVMYPLLTSSHPVSACQVLGLQVCVITPSSLSFFNEVFKARKVIRHFKGAKSPSFDLVSDCRKEMGIVSNAGQVMLYNGQASDHIMAFKL